MTEDPDDETASAAERKAEGLRELVRTRGGQPDKKGKRRDSEDRPKPENPKEN